MRAREADRLIPGSTKQELALFNFCYEYYANDPRYCVRDPVDGVSFIIFFNLQKISKTEKFYYVFYSFLAGDPNQISLLRECWEMCCFAGVG